MREYKANTEERKLIFEFIKNNKYRDIVYDLDTRYNDIKGYENSDTFEGWVTVVYNDNYYFTIYDAVSKYNEISTRSLTDLKFVIFDESYNVDLYFTSNNIFIGNSEISKILQEIVEEARDTKYIGKSLERKLQLFNITK